MPAKDFPHAAGRIVAGVGFEHDARAGPPEDLPGTTEYGMLEPFQVNLQEIRLEIQFLDNRIERPALDPDDPPTFATIASQ
jgi:hypothetical protein